MSDSMNISTEAATTITSDDGNTASRSPSLEEYTLPYYATEVDAVHESIQKAIDLVQYYSEQTEQHTTDGASVTMTTDKSSTTAVTTTTTATLNPDEIYQQLDTARNQITQSWQALYTAFHSTTEHDDNNNHNNQGNPLTEQEQIRIAYLNMITDSFGNVLEQLHNENNNNNNNININENINVDVLADCLQSGYDLLTQFNASASSTLYDNDFVWNDNDDDDKNDHMYDDDMDDDTNHSETPHERHRQQLGFQEVH